MTLKHFSLDEFDSPDSPGSGIHMDPAFLNMLDATREDAKIPFPVNSGYRTPARNLLDGGKPDSAHLKGHAADIAAPSGTAKFLIIQSALRNGFRRIGVGSNFVHLDNDISLPPNVIWTY
jgi:zinc D-Ala-D-Ala carboxypeptidase